MVAIPSLSRLLLFIQGVQLVGNNFISLKHISANTPLSLEQKMLQLNMNTGLEIKFHFIQFVDKKWYAWYYTDRRNEVITNAVKELKDDTRRPRTK